MVNLVRGLEEGGFDTGRLVLASCVLATGQSVVEEVTVEEDEVAADVSVPLFTSGNTLKGTHEISSLPVKRNNEVKVLYVTSS